MATSGSINFDQNATSIIEDAFYNLNAYGVGESIEPEDYELARRILNRMIKNWQAYGIFFWTYTEGYLFPQKDQRKYVTGTDHFTDTAVISATTVAASSGASTLTLSTTGMTTGDQCGVELDDGTRQWTTLTVDSATQITLGTTLDDDVAVGNNVFTYTTKSDWPIHIQDIRYYDYSDDIERPMKQLEYIEYHQIVDKTIEQESSGYMYDRQKNPGNLFICPEISSIEDYYKISYQRVLQDIDAATDNIDFPQEWLHPIVLNLSVLLSHPMQIRATDDLRRDAKEAFENARRMDNRMESLELMFEEDTY